MGWIDTLLSFDSELVHIPGIQNLLPDALSRLWPEHSLNISDERNAFVQMQAMPIVPESERKEKLDEAHALGHYGSSQMIKQLRSLLARNES